MSERRCMFCGLPFTGQKHNFEHVISDWLVKEADLKWRTSAVDLPSKKFDAAMNRIGGRVCEACNSTSSDLEGRARTAYAKLRDGEQLLEADGEALLDWLDKVRVGMWLWTVDVSKNDYGVDPKFRINERTAHKDRLLLAAKYAPDQAGKGLGIWGATEHFVWSPSCLGLFVNNIVLLSISTNFLVARHLVNLDIKQRVDYGGDANVDIDLGTHPGPRLEFFAAPLILGQVILPVDMFTELGLEMARNSPRHAGWGEGPILRLNGKLQEIGRLPTVLPLFTGKIDAHMLLMEMYLDKANKYLIEDVLSADLSQAGDAESQQTMRAQYEEYLLRTQADLDQFAARYQALTGLRLST
ncbi:hypothetical protein [Bradyrhizobium sp. RT3a]|uniref:hypothetical protein n=1 Tax=unclassified Bradyrhizobium TaxID=2631580 RepID=UPI003396140E